MRANKEDREDGQYRATSDGERVQEELGERLCSNCQYRMVTPFSYCQYAAGMRNMVQTLSADVAEAVMKHQELASHPRVQNEMQKILAEPIQADHLAQICGAFTPIKPLKQSLLTR